MNAHILIDCSILIHMFEGNNDDKAKEFMVLMKKSKDEGKDLEIKTSMSQFLRALWLSDSKIPIHNIQKVLSFTNVLPSFADFKNEEACTKELLIIAEVLGSKNENKY